MEKLQDNYEKMLNEKKTETDNLTSTIDKLKDSNKNLEDKLKAIEKELNEKKNQIAASSSVPNQQQQAVQNTPLPRPNPPSACFPPSPPLSQYDEFPPFINPYRNITSPSYINQSRSTLSSSANQAGTFISRGSANGRVVYRGPREGLYYLTDSGEKHYVKSNQVDPF